MGTKVPRLPSPKIKPQMSRTPPPETNPPPPPPPPQQSPAALEEARRRLQEAILIYKDLLTSNTLASNRSTEEIEKRNQLIFSLNNLAGELDFLNVGEGMMTLNLTALHSIMMLKDEINDLKFQNAYLNKKVKPLIK